MFVWFVNVNINRYCRIVNFLTTQLFFEGYIYRATGHATDEQMGFFDGVGSVLRFQIPKFDPCLLYPYDTLILAHIIVLLLYHFDTLSPHTVTPQRKEGDHTQTKGNILQGGRLFALNYPPHINPPNIPRHNFPINRYFFQNIIGQKKTPFLSIFIVLYL